MNCNQRLLGSIAAFLLVFPCTSAWSLTMLSKFTRIAARNPSRLLSSRSLHFFQRTSRSTRTTPSTTTYCSTRLFGSKPGPNSQPGEILVDNDQTDLAVDTDRLIKTMTDIRKRLGYETYDVSLLLVNDEEMRNTNSNTRGVDAPTDILSFPFHNAVEPGTLVDPEFDIPDYYNLGDMMLDVPYVIRRCQEDQQDNGDGGGMDDGEEEDRGVSGAMATVYDPQDRINMLLVHGMLHLVGHDHEDDDEYEAMVSKEEEIMEQLGILPEATHQK